MNQPVGKARLGYDVQRAAKLRDRLYRREAGAVARLTQQTLERLLRPGANGSILQREMRESLATAPLRYLFPRFRCWSQNTFRLKVEACLPLYIAVFSDNLEWFDEFAAELESGATRLRRMRNGEQFVQRLVWLMAQAVTSSLFPLSLGERGARTAKHLVSTFAPTLALRLSDWMDFTEAVDAYLKRNNAGPFFGTDFLLGDAT